jgi:hypothetical protein
MTGGMTDQYNPVAYRKPMISMVSTTMMTTDRYRNTFLMP